MLFHIELFKAKLELAHRDHLRNLANYREAELLVAEQSWRTMVLLFESAIEILDTVEAGTESDISNGQMGGAQHQCCMLKPRIDKLMG